jgi:hypothetical protein
MLLLRPARCSCGLLWPCLEVSLEQIRRRPVVDVPLPDWAAATQPYPKVGRIASVAPGRTQHVSGAHWPEPARRRRP